MPADPPAILWDAVLYLTAGLYAVIAVRLVSAARDVAAAATLTPTAPRPWKCYAAAAYLSLLAARRLTLTADPGAGLPWASFAIDAALLPVAGLVAVAVELFAARCRRHVDAVSGELDDAVRRLAEASAAWEAAVRQALATTPGGTHRAD